MSFCYFLVLCISTHYPSYFALRSESLAYNEDDPVAVTDGIERGLFSIHKMRLLISYLSWIREKRAGLLSLMPSIPGPHTFLKYNNAQGLYTKTSQS
jgi:hypothetical protein